MGATVDGKKELLAVWDGERESKESWRAVLRDLKRRGLRESPKLATGDGALGFWAALREEFPETQEQRCWVHKTVNILDKLPKRLQRDAKKLIHEKKWRKLNGYSLVAKVIDGVRFVDGEEQKVAA